MEFAVFGGSKPSRLSLAQPPTQTCSAGRLQQRAVRGASCDDRADHGEAHATGKACQMASNFPRISSPFYFVLRFFGVPLFSTNQAKKIIFFARVLIPA